MKQISNMQRNIILFLLAIFAFSSFRVIYAKNLTGNTCGPIKFKVNVREFYESDGKLFHLIILKHVANI